MVDDAPAGKRNGAVQPELEAIFLEQLDAVVAHLRAEYPDSGYDNANLAQLLVHFLQFMEEVAGKNGTHKAQPKIPVKLFRDTRAEGPLFALAARIHQIKKLRDMKSIEFHNPQRRREHLEIYLNCRRELEKLNMIQLPKVFLDPSCLPQDQSRMRDIINKLGGQLASAEDDPGVTHHVFPFPPSGDPDDGKVYLRVQEFRGTKALVHWWYLPDSYDEYVSRDLVPDQLDPDPEPCGPCKVYIRWVYDSEKYNEWMNPTDYETKEAQEEQEHAAGGENGQLADPGSTAADQAASHGAAGADQALAAPIPAPGLPNAGLPLGGARGGASHHGGKRPGSPHRHDGGGHTGKRLKPGEGHAPAPEVAAGPGERVAVNVVQHVLQAPPKALTDASLPTENLSLGQRALVPGSSRTQVISQLRTLPDPSSIPSTSQAQPRRVISRQERAWFNMDAINECERQAVPEFFNGRCPSKTTRTYKESRNFIVTKYRERQGQRLEFSDIKDQLSGDTGSMYRIFEFLEERGIVNYSEPDDAAGSLPPRPPTHPGGQRSAFKMAMQREGTRRPYLFSSPENCHEEGLLAASTGGSSFNLHSRKPLYNHDPTIDYASTADHYCAVMPWVKCNEVRYHCTKLPNVDLCPEAFAEGRFPPGLSSRDFVRIDRKSPQLDENGWSGTENLLLLEALELFGDNWGQVAEHVGTRSQVQCILQFLQLPIDDLLIGELENGLRHPPASQAASKAAGTPPFTSAGNPVMAQISFLATVVGPKVAASAAMRALEVLGEQAAPAGAADAAEIDLGSVPLSAEAVAAAANSALTAAAERARQLAGQEELELQRLVAAALRVQAQKVQVKLKYLDALNKALESEQAALDAMQSTSQGA